LYVSAVAAQAAGRTVEGKPLQQAAIEGQRQQIAQPVAAFLLGKVRQDDLDVSSKLPEHLPTGTTRRRRLVGVRGDHDPGKCALSVREGFEDRNTLCADGEAVGRVLDVAAGEDPAVCGFECGADFEPLEVGAGMVSCQACSGDELLDIRGGQ
jgi:hypothetical protein